MAQCARNAQPRGSITLYPRLRGALVRRLAAVLGSVALLTVVTSTPAPAAGQGDGEELVALPVGTDVDYQLGGVRSVPARVGVVVRDRTAEPETDRYNICYVNGFQTQDSERDFWAKRMKLVLHHHGEPVVDEAWGEWLLDIRTEAKRDRLAVIMGRWISGCADDGFDAVEFDNLDSFTRSGGLLDRADAVAFARLLIASAHGAGLAAGQKNLAQLDGTEIGYDFAVAEECGRYRECGDYVDHYGDQVLAIEYRARDFKRTCAHHGASLAVVLRDRALSSDGRRRWC